MNGRKPTYLELQFLKEIVALPHDVMEQFPPSFIQAWEDWKFEIGMETRGGHPPA